MKGWLRQLRRPAAWLLLAALLGAWGLAAAAGLHASWHDCTGEECPVCATASLCEAALQLFGAGEMRDAPRVAAPIAVAALAAAAPGRTAARVTPVSLKVRMDW